MLADPTSVPFTPEIHNILEPHQAVLEMLVCWDPISGKSPVPATDYILLKQGFGEPEAIKRGMVPFTGDLDTEQQAQIKNWIYKKVVGAPSELHKWMGGVAFAHAVTLVIAHRDHSLILQDEDFPAEGSADAQEAFILDKAWSRQKDVRRNSDEQTYFVDVDRECLQDFERRLFERSKDAGPAGFFQWGLDVGDHQNKWDPYQGLPEFWNLGDMDPDEDTLQVNHCDDLRTEVVLTSALNRKGRNISGRNLQHRCLYSIGNGRGNPRRALAQA